MLEEQEAFVLGVEVLVVLDYEANRNSRDKDPISGSSFLSAAWPVAVATQTGAGTGRDGLWNASPEFPECGCSLATGATDRKVE